jgi:hypothetical protein
VYAFRRAVQGYRFRLAAVTALTLLLAFLYFAWPTPWVYLQVARPGSPYLAARVHRLTGRTELLTRRGWWTARRDLLTPPDTARDLTMAPR